MSMYVVPARKTQSAFAREIGWRRARFKQFIEARRGVTAGAALDLAEVPGTSPRLWMNLQATHDPDEDTRKRQAA